MAYVHTLQRRLLVAALIFVLASSCAAQRRQPARPPQAPPAPWSADLDKYPGLLPEFGQLVEKLQRDVQFPPARSHSRLLPLLPAPATIYIALPNYGQAMQQAVTIFRQELQTSPVLRDWWQHSQVAKSGPKVLDSLERFAQVSQYLGEEIVISGRTEEREPTFLLVAEVRKPGLKSALQQFVNEISEKSKPGVRILDPQELAAARDLRPTQDLNVLVRPDLVIAAGDPAALRSFNERLDSGTHEFAASPFGQRLAQSYAGGVTLLAAANLQQILKRVPTSSKEEQALQRGGLSDMQYVVWEHTTAAGQPISQMELSFAGPRRGIASWLAAPAPLGSLEFASAKPMLVTSLVLTSPAQIFDQIRELATASNPNAFASLPQMEQTLQLNLRDDLLRYLTGEITLDIENLNPPMPAAKAILRVSDPASLQQSLSRLLQAAHLSAEEFAQGGVTYHAVQVTAGKAAIEIAYTFVDGYLVIGAGRENVAEAVRLHQTGGSLGKSQAFLAALPPGHPAGMSAMLYQDPIAMTALRLRQVAPELAAALAQSETEGKPAVNAVYAEPTVIRAASTSAGVDAGAILVVAAIAIPNLLRARVAANEASAVGSLRSVVTAEITYAASFPRRGYASDLATLGPGPSGNSQNSPKYAGYLDPTLAGASCTADTWCVKSGYRFRVSGICTQPRCRDFVALATPVSSSTGGRSFCTTSDGVIRFSLGAPLTAPISITQCKTWAPLR